MMGWGGIDAIPLLPDETRAAAVDRVYAGGALIVLDSNAVPHMASYSGVSRDRTKVTKAERQWMLDAVDTLEEVRPGWTVTTSEVPAGRRWPDALSLEHPKSIMVVEVAPDYANFKSYGGEADEEEWRFWWRILRRFARRPCAIYDPDCSQLVTMSLSAPDARERYAFV